MEEVKPQYIGRFDKEGGAVYLYKNKGNFTVQELVNEWGWGSHEINLISKICDTEEEVLKDLQKIAGLKFELNRKHYSYSNYLNDFFLYDLYITKDYNVRFLIEKGTDISNIFSLKICAKISKHLSDSDITKVLGKNVIDLEQFTENMVNCSLNELANRTFIGMENFKSLDFKEVEAVPEINHYNPSLTITHGYDVKETESSICYFCEKSLKDCLIKFQGKINFVDANTNSERSLFCYDSEYFCKGCFLQKVFNSFCNFKTLQCAIFDNAFKEYAQYNLETKGKFELSVAKENDIFKFISSSELETLKNEVLKLAEDRVKETAELKLTVASLEKKLKVLEGAGVKLSENTFKEIGLRAETETQLNESLKRFKALEAEHLKLKALPCGLICVKCKAPSPHNQSNQENGTYLCRTC